jgi:putative oxidoreductase
VEPKLSLDVALLILRIVVGAYLFAHGTQKLFGWFGGGGLAKTTTVMGSMLRFRPVLFWTLAAGLSESAGALLVLGLLTPLASAGVSAAMLTAILSSHLGKGWFASTRGPELALTNLTVAIAIAFAGPGQFSLDSALGISFPEPITLTSLAVLVILGVAVAFLTRRAPQPATKTETV